MVIYAEYLFLENAVTGGMILLLTGRISGIHCRSRRLILGSILCGLYSFVLFWDQLNSFPAILLKAGFSAILIQLVFLPKAPRRFARVLLVFYLVSFAMGGITIGMMYFMGILGVTQNTSIYLGLKGYLCLLPGCILAWFGISALAGLIKGRMTREKTCAEVEIVLEGKHTLLWGMMDTGNQLKDPLSGKPVMVIAEAAARALLPDEIVDAALTGGQTCRIPEELAQSCYAERIRLIPFHTVGQRHGCMVGIRPDSVRITVPHKKHGEQSAALLKGTILAISGDMSLRDDTGEACSILLHPNLFEKGIACDG